MTEKRYKRLSDEEINNLLNELNEENQQLKEALKELKEIGDYQANRIYELQDENEQVKKVLQKYFDKYTRMAVELRRDKYGNGICHDVTEVISEIADELDIKLDVMGFMK